MLPRRIASLLLALAAGACTGGETFVGQAAFESVRLTDLAGVPGLAPSRTLLAALPEATADRLRAGVTAGRFGPGEPVLVVRFAADADLWAVAGLHGWDFRVHAVPCRQAPGRFDEFIALPEVLAGDTALGTAMARPEGLARRPPWHYAVVILARNPQADPAHPAYDLTRSPVALCPLVHGGMRDVSFRLTGLAVPAAALPR